MGQCILALHKSVTDSFQGIAITKNTLKINNIIFFGSPVHAKSADSWIGSSSKDFKKFTELIFILTSLSHIVLSVDGPLWKTNCSNMKMLLLKIVSSKVLK